MDLPDEGIPGIPGILLHKDQVPPAWCNFPTSQLTTEHLALSIEDIKREYMSGKPINYPPDVYYVPMDELLKGA